MTNALARSDNNVGEDASPSRGRSSKRDRTGRVLTILVYFLGITIISGATALALWYYWTQVPLGGDGLDDFVKAYSTAPAVIKARYRDEIINDRLTHSVAHRFFGDLSKSREQAEMNELKKAAR